MRGDDNFSIIFIVFPFIYKVKFLVNVKFVLFSVLFCRLLVVVA